MTAGIGQGYIGIDRNMRGREEKTRLAHEVGHCETGTYYVRHMPKICRRRNENRANRWAYENVLPFCEIQAALDEGNHDIWELAEYFDVTDEFMAGALRYYTETRELRFSAE
jgi:Zn-dependent peptidase ImmA (M78 family)